MRIIMFTNTYLPHVGGVARSVKTFASDLRALGNRVLIIAPAFPGHEEQDRQETEIVRVPAVQKFNGSDFSVRIPVPFYMDEAIDEFAPDLIHSHHPYLLGDAALRAARRRRLPLVFTHHTLYEAYAHHMNVDSETLKAFVVRLATEYANLCDRVIAPSQSLEALITRRGVETGVSEIPTGVDLDFFSRGDPEAFRQDYKIPEDRMVIGHVGRLAEEKNLSFLVSAVAGALEEAPRALFLVVGEGPEQEAIQESFGNRGLGDRLIMTGSLTGSSLAGAYRAMDLFAFSSHTETQGLVLTEAMAAGTPVVALDAPGAREVVRDNTNGRLLPGDTSEEDFSAVLTNLVRRPASARSDLEASARDTAKAFSRRASARRLMAVYQDLAFREDLSHSRDMEPWETLLGGLKAEWELATQKTVSLVQTLGSLREKEGA